MSNFTIVEASAVHTTGAASTPFFNQGAFPLSVFVSVTSGTTVSVSDFRVWAQGSLDNGVTWNDIPFEFIVKSGSTAAGNLTANSTNLLKESATVGSANYWGRTLYALPYMRMKWDVVGGPASPGETFQIMVAGLTGGV